MKKSKNARVQYTGFILFLLSFCPSFTSSLDCPLKWVQKDLGNIPQFAIEAGPGEFLARVWIESQAEWKVGKLRPNQMTFFLFFDGKVESFDSYYILTNPDNCILDWEPSSRTDTVLPDSVVEIDNGDARYVGRGKFQGYVIGGTIEPSYGILVTHEDAEYVLWEYQVLTSKYPLLSGVITEMEFDRTDYLSVYSESLMELVGSEFFYAKHKILSTTFIDDETLNFDKRITEKFIFREDLHSWNGLENLEITFSLWSGSPDVTAILPVKRKSKLTVLRKRDVNFHANIKFQDALIYQICTVIQVPRDNHPVKFNATMEITAPNMTLSQIKHILSETGRNYLDEDPEFNTITTRISGTMVGRYVVERGTFLVTLKNSKCAAQCHKLHRQRRRLDLIPEPDCVDDPP